MKQHSLKEKVKYSIFTGLGKTLALTFLMFALFPMVVIILISYDSFHKSLKEQTKTALKILVNSKSREISNYFERMQITLRQQAETILNAQFLDVMEIVYQTSGKPLDKFIRSQMWDSVVDEFSSDITRFCKMYKYHDIFLINNNGDILYTVAFEKDIGTNLLTGKYKSSKFAAAVRKSIKTGGFVFSDYESYGPSQNEVFGFFINRLINESGEKVGVIAFQFNTDSINNIMQEKTGLGATAETYLIGTDLKLRSELKQGSKKNLIKEKIITDQTKLFKQHLEKKTDGVEIENYFLIYNGLHGREVLGIHNEIIIQDVVFGVIAEIEKKEAFAVIDNLYRTMTYVIFITILVTVFFIIFLVRHIIRPVLKLSSGAKNVTGGDFSHIINTDTKNEIGDLTVAFNDMIDTLSSAQEEAKLGDWFKTGQMGMGKKMNGILKLPELCFSIITFLAKYLNADIGAIYIVNDNNYLKLAGSYAFPKRKHISNEFEFGQGLVGQAAFEKQQIMLTCVPDDYIVIQSGLGETKPNCIIVNPFLYNNEVIGVIELGAIEPFSEKALEFLNLVSEEIAVAIQTLIAHINVQELLGKTQIQASQLKEQKTRLSRSNEKLERQAKSLKKSEKSLQIQQEELRQTNDELSKQSVELEEQTAQLEGQQSEIKKRNIELELAKKEIEKKAKDISASSNYKSEFLANMSHELRTPLNSILLLSKYLADNRAGDMTEKQVECASTINTSGNELLTLINEVLDLSKIEAGQMVLQLDDIAIADVSSGMKRNFTATALEKGIDFKINISKELPEFIRTDNQRLSQILKNLLSNAFKFTDKGSVTLDICRPSFDMNCKFKKSDTTVVFLVKDTGIGIPDDKQDIIFHAFKQVDGSTSRDYRGTGLGLSISREFADLLCGSLTVSSSYGEGSVFTLCIPEKIEEKTEGFYELKKKDLLPMQIPEKKVSETYKKEEYVRDDRKIITSESRSVLIIEDDQKFAKILLDVAREKGFKVLVAESGEIGLHMTDTYSPKGIIMDMVLPGMDGRNVLARLKDNLATRHIPVQVISACDRDHEIMQMGAVGYLTKPVTMESMDCVFDRIEKVYSKKVKEILLIEDNKVTQKLILNLLENNRDKVTVASTGKEAKNFISKKDFDCIILDLGLPDISGINLLVELKKQTDFSIPVIVHTSRDLTEDERVILDSFAEKVVVKSTKSREKLLDETTLFLHHIEADLPEEKREMLRMIHDKEAILQNKKILVVDDDMRNVFALMNILESMEVKIITAGTGKESLVKLKENPDIDLVLMDIMMPEMDGYDAIKEIRKMDAKLRKIPVIALTAKAMKGDREKCIKSGANDYLSKPVDGDKLLSMLRVWLY